MMSFQCCYSMSFSKTILASSTELPQNNDSGLKPLHTWGRAGSVKTAHFRSSVNCTHRTPAGLPEGIPGIEELIEG